MSEKKFEIQPEKKFQVNYEYKRYSDNSLLAHVEPIQEGMLDPESSDRKIETLVEYPLLEVAKSFMLKGIKTYSSSANKNDIKNREAYIILHFYSLSENNKIIAERYKVYEQQSYKIEKLVKISVAVNKNTTVGEIRSKFEKIVAMFESQV